jgi:hypothetical protein
MILTNLYVSDQIISFNTDFLIKNGIECLFNCSQETPFISDITDNKRCMLFPMSKKKSKKQSTQSSSSSSDSDGSQEEPLGMSIETIAVTLNHSLEWIFQRLAQNKKVLVYCENGIQKSSIIIACFLMKYYTKGTILDVHKALHFIEAKINKPVHSKYLNIVYGYHKYLVIQLSAQQIPSPKISTKPVYSGTSLDMKRRVQSVFG